MRTKKALTACFLILVFVAINHIAFGDVVNGVVDGDAPTPVEVNPSRGVTSPPSAATLINFDDVSAPCVFASTTALRYKSGVIFLGTPTSSKNGGAILDECGNFGISGHSPPNFLAFNGNSTLSDGGKPTYPEILIFVSPVSAVQINAACRYGGQTFMLAFGSSSKIDADKISSNPQELKKLKGFVGYDVITNSSQMQTLSIQGKGIRLVIITASGVSSPVIVLDDLNFVTSAQAAPSKKQNETLSTTWGALKER